MKKGWIVFGVIALVIIILIFSVVGSYNGLVSTQEKVKTAQSAIDSQLKRRTDLIPNLVETVKGFAQQEQTILSDIANARARLAGAATMADKAQADAELSGALSRLLVVVENYPELKSDRTFIGLMDELAGTENRINTSRLDYNNAVNAYNTRIRSFPTVIIAGIFGFDAAEYYEASETDRETPQVSFGLK